MKKVITFIPLLVILFLSCDKYSDYQMIIDNRTDETINFFFSGTTAYTNGTESVITLPNNQNTYFDSYGRKMKALECDPQINQSEVTIEISNNKTLLKDISNKENWNCITDKKHNYWKMIFIITLEDLQ